MREFLGFAWQNKAWWIIPIVVTLLLLTAVMVVTQTAVPAFIYTIFG